MQNLLHIFSSSGAGGTEHICADAIRAMDVSRFVHDVVFTDRRGFVVPRYQAVARRVEVPGGAGVADCLVRLTQMMASTRYDAVVAYGGRANAIHRLARLHPVCRRPVYVMALRGRVTDSDSRLRAAVDRLTAWPVEFVFANSQAAVDALEAAEYRAKPYGVAYNGVDCGVFFPASQRLASRRACGLPEDGTMVLSTSHLRKAKNIPLLLRAFAAAHARYPDTFLVLAGDPILETELVPLSVALGIRDSVMFLGRRLDVPELLRAADLFALTSDHEGMPNGLIQAMATGLASVATRVGGVPELVHDDVSGLLVPPGDVQAMAASMTRCLEDSTLRERLSSGALTRIRDHFTSATMGAQWGEVLDRAIAVRARAMDLDSS